MREIEKIERDMYELYREIQESSGRKPFTFEDWKKLNEIIN